MCLLSKHRHVYLIAVFTGFCAGYLLQKVESCITIVNGKYGTYVLQITNGNFDAYIAIE